MMPLEYAIREAARLGRLSRTSIVADPSGRGWQASAPSDHGEGWAVAIHADPVAALLEALRVREPAPAADGGVFD